MYQIIAWPSGWADFKLTHYQNGIAIGLWRGTSPAWTDTGMQCQNGGLSDHDNRSLTEND